MLTDEELYLYRACLDAADFGYDADDSNDRWKLYMYSVDRFETAAWENDKQTFLRALNKCQYLNVEENKYKEPMEFVVVRLGDSFNVLEKSLLPKLGIQ